MALNRYSDSERYLLRSLKLISGSGSIVGELALVPSLCELYRRTSRHTKAKETLIQAQKTMGEAADWGALHGDLRLEEALVSAALGSWEDGEEFFQTAVQAYREFDLPWDKARAYYEWALVLMGEEHDGSRGDQARTLLGQALELWEPMGASRYAEQCRAILAE